VILCDTGPLVAAFNAADRDHGRAGRLHRIGLSVIVRVLPSGLVPRTGVGKAVRVRP
jgi:hypothetical protein